MGQIRVLPDHLANQIAAGEVVERPASALKELLENSFDADARSVRIYLERGGKKRIQVEDDGYGMDRDDCLMAMERHATSKLTRAEDLFSIKTLGFRGEALPSIASVSRFTLETQARGEESGVRLEMHGTKLLKVSEISRTAGTKVTVDQLFFNIPARKKFLRKTETELGWMVNLVTQYSMVHLNKHLYLEHDGRTLVDVPPVATLKERIYQHFGKKMLAELVPVDFERDWIRVKGMVSTPSFFKTSRSHQYLFVNGRLVRDKVLNHAITDAYEGFGEGRVFPVVFLFVEVPSQEVDVNVHPAKTEIKFIQSNWVHDAVRDAIRQPLLDQKLTLPYRFREGYHPHPSQPLQQRQQGGPPPPQPLPGDQGANQAFLPGNDPIAQSPLFSEPKPQDQSPYQRFLARNQGWLDRPDETVPAPGAVPSEADPRHAAGEAASGHEHLFAGDPKISLPRVIGQFRDSYILAEQEGDLLLIDQHVAHERILYDQVTSALAKGGVERQALLVPLTVEFTHQQTIDAEEWMPAVQSFGFTLEPYGGQAYIVREIPVFAAGEDIGAMVCELVEKVQGQRRDSALETMVDHYAATKACKAAVKINMHLTLEKMNHLIETLWSTSSPLFCPHGRPIILRFSNEEIEKNFLRR